MLKVCAALPDVPCCIWHTYQQLLQPLLNSAVSFDCESDKAVYHFMAGLNAALQVVIKNSLWCYTRCSIRLARIFQVTAIDTSMKTMQTICQYC